MKKSYKIRIIIGIATVLSIILVVCLLIIKPFDKKDKLKIYVFCNGENTSCLTLNPKSNKSSLTTVNGSEYEGTYEEKGMYITMKLNNDINVYTFKNGIINIKYVAKKSTPLQQDDIEENAKFKKLKFDSKNNYKLVNNRIIVDRKTYDIDKNFKYEKWAIESNPTVSISTYDIIVKEGAKTKAKVTMKLYDDCLFRFVKYDGQLKLLAVSNDYNSSVTIPKTHLYNIVLDGDKVILSANGYRSDSNIIKILL